jgi:glutamate synthase domain-containing protein 2
VTRFKRFIRPKPWWRRRQQRTRKEYREWKERESEKGNETGNETAKKKEEREEKREKKSDFSYGAVAKSKTISIARTGERFAQ